MLPPSSSVFPGALRGLKPSGDPNALSDAPWSSAGRLPLGRERGVGKEAIQESRGVVCLDEVFYVAWNPTDGVACHLFGGPSIMGTGSLMHVRLVSPASPLSRRVWGPMVRRGQSPAVLSCVMRRCAPGNHADGTEGNAAGRSLRHPGPPQRRAPAEAGRA